jgi:hypothetical protein
MGDNSEWSHNLAEDVNLSINRRHPTSFPLCFLLFFNFMWLIIFSFFLFSSIILVLCFSGTKGTSVQVWGYAMSHSNLDSPPSPRLALSMLFRDNV